MMGLPKQAVLQGEGVCSMKTCCNCPHTPFLSKSEHNQRYTSPPQSDLTKAPVGPSEVERSISILFFLLDFRFCKLPSVEGLVPVCWGWGGRGGDVGG